MRLPVLDPSRFELADRTNRTAQRGLADSYGRGVGYLRLSLTKACAMRCTYCRPERITSTRGEPMLDVDEIETLICFLAERHGLSKVRLTGGDPTSRRELTEIIARIASIPGIHDVAMTTNGLTLERRAKEYAAAGLQRINISLDTLDPERFAQLTGVDELPRVLRGLDAAIEAGLGPIRLNSVVVKGQNEFDLPSLVRFAAQRGLEARFIELMPMGPLASVWRERYVPEARMHEILRQTVVDWQPLHQGHDAARRYRVMLDDGAETIIGFITPMSCNFCAACNRIRIAADGTFYPCLMDRPIGTILPALRPGFDEELLDSILKRGLDGKREEHPHDGYGVMTHIGG